MAQRMYCWHQHSAIDIDNLLMQCAMLQVLQSADAMWHANSHTAAVTYASTTHSGISYRPSTASNRPSTASNRPSTASHRPSTAHPSCFTPVPSSRQARPASARESSGRGSAAALAGGLRDKTSMLGSSVVAHPDMQITKLLHSKGYRSVSPMSDGSTGATPSPAQTPCSVLSRPTTAGRGDTCMSLGPLLGLLTCLVVLLSGSMCKLTVREVHAVSKHSLS